MSLYDTVKNSDSPYMSQYVGSIVPELNDYSKVMQNKYNVAADTDDQLTEALNNLQHLGLAADSQYANELKQQYYQKLQDRAGRGDYENMGRRTARDAMNFSAAYQPLLQRQRDMGEVTKRVLTDPNIASPETKQAILGKIQYMNSTQVDPETGDFKRDSAGRVQLPGIQDWSYAKDVDKNKKLADLLSKKEAEIRTTGYTSNGSGERVQTITELRSAKNMASLADMIQRTDPEIKAMTDRDIDLRTYRMSPEDVASGLKQADVSSYQRLRRQGLSDHDIRVHAKAAGTTINELKQSQVKQRLQQYLSSGFTSEAANKAVYNDMLGEQLRSGSNELMGDLFSVHKVKQDEHTDEPYMAHLRKNLENVGAGVQFIQNPPATASDVSASDLAGNYAKKQQGVTQVQSDLQASVLAGLQHSKMATGDPKKDVAMAIEYTNDPVKLATLASALQATSPELADRLQTAGNNYRSVLNDLNNSKAAVKGLEETSGVDMSKLYHDYIQSKDKEQNLINKARKTKEVPTIISYSDFSNAIRSKDNPEGGFIKRALMGSDAHLQEARDNYQDMIEKGMDKFRKDPTQKISYTSMQPNKDDDYFGKLTGSVEENAKAGALQLTDVGIPDDTGGSLASKLGVDPTTESGRTFMKGTKVLVNQELGPAGKLTATAYTPKGNHTFSIENLDPNTQREILHRVIDGNGVGTDRTFTKTQKERAYQALGGTTMNPGADLTLETYSPSSAIYPINDQFSVRIKPGGSLGKQYELYRKIDGKPTPVGYSAKSIEDLKYELGYLDYHTK